MFFVTLKLALVPLILYLYILKPSARVEVTKVLLNAGTGFNDFFVSFPDGFKMV